jgi:pimeloyl-ACP methyl ester carboxylesterase
LLHGGHGSWRHWDSNLTALSDDLDLVVPDLPGFGQSCDLPQDSTLDLMAHGLHEAVIGECGRAPDLIIGFSFGALVAAVMAGMAGGARPASVLVNPPLGKDVSAEVIAILEEAAAKVRRGGLAAGIEHSLRNIMLSDQRLVTADLIAQASAQARQARFASRRLSRVTDIRPLLVPLAGRCDLVLGGRDPHQRASLAERLPQYRQILGNHRVHVVPEAAHWLQRDCPDIFARIVRSAAQRIGENVS